MFICFKLNDNKLYISSTGGFSYTFRSNQICLNPRLGGQVFVYCSQSYGSENLLFTIFPLVLGTLTYLWHESRRIINLSTIKSDLDRFLNTYIQDGSPKKVKPQHYATDFWQPTESKYNIFPRRARYYMYDTN